MNNSSQTLHNKLIDFIRIFNKHIFNRLTLKLTESGKGPFTIVYHRGRYTGRTYRTPVLASFMAGTIIIPLSYGEYVDWLRNILTQGDCEFFHGGERFVAVDPEVIESATAFELLPEERRKLFERFKLEKFLRMHLAECGVDMGNVSFNCSSSKID